MHHPTRSLTIALVLLLGAGSLAGQASPTRLLVRAVSHDAKIIGSNVGGARITIREAGTGRLLAEGIQQGGTGSTELIMQRPRQRGDRLFDTPGAAGFLATIALAGPTQVEIAAEAPLGTPHAMQRASKSFLAIPGVDVLGEGIVLELNGFTVEILSPGEGRLAGVAVPVQARVTMLCGCPTEPGGLWDADRIQILARLTAAGRPVAETALDYTGQTSMYGGTLTAPGAGRYTLEVFALEPARANTGMASRSVEVGGP